jgi:uncharacterized repeat protein (TIGR01451 family)
MVVEPAQADLSPTKIDSKDPIKPGASLIYALTVKNLGPNTSQTLTLVNTLDRNTTYVSISAPKGRTLDLPVRQLCNDMHQHPPSQRQQRGYQDHCNGQQDRQGWQGTRQ